MKKIIVLFVVAFSVATVYAQQDWHWDHHGVGFTAPSDFVVSVNNAEEFSAENGHVFLSILPWQDGYIDEDDLVDGLIVIAEELEYDEITEAEELEIQDFVGYGVNGIKDGANAIIALLLDLESSTNLVVVIAYDSSYEDDAAMILGSLYAYDE